MASGPVSTERSVCRARRNNKQPCCIGSRQMRLGHPRAAKTCWGEGMSEEAEAEAEWPALRPHSSTQRGVLVSTLESARTWGVDIL